MQLSQIQQKATPILAQFGVRKAALFGSVARGEATKDSDIDLLVQLDKTLSLFGFIDLKLQLEDALGKKVDLVQYDGIKKSLRDYILKDEKVFFQA